VWHANDEGVRAVDGRSAVDRALQGGDHGLTTVQTEPLRRVEFSRKEGL